MCEKVQGIAGVYLFHDFTARGRKNHLATMVSRRMCAIKWNSVWIEDSGLR